MIRSVTRIVKFSSYIMRMIQSRMIRCAGHAECTEGKQSNTKLWA